MFITQLKNHFPIADKLLTRNRERRWIINKRGVYSHALRCDRWKSILSNYNDERKCSERTRRIQYHRRQFAEKVYSLSDISLSRVSPPAVLFPMAGKWKTSLRTRGARHHQRTSVARYSHSEVGNYAGEFQASQKIDCPLSSSTSGAPFGATSPRIVSRELMKQKYMFKSLIKLIEARLLFRFKRYCWGLISEAKKKKEKKKQQKEKVLNASVINLSV